ncbi:MAG TPA: glutamine cyclotransferase [Candidatus Cloacimonas sp.]|jgi:hypothetical protein|nr:glutaminyl-peptide cyclotransferase [Candidatus Cloacimonadota bacterium]HCX72623.1 glutamine cyclotransferase [Candidatus Cloacimonas sp.]
MKKLSILFLFLLLISCQVNVPKFNSNLAWQYLEEQCALGARVPGSDEIELCRNYITTILERSDAAIEQQHFEAQIDSINYPGVNIIAHFYPRRSRRILLGAHYDTRPWADKEENSQLHTIPIIGANDAASGVAVLLEIANVLGKYEPPQYGVDLVFFDLEDMGDYGERETWCLGSKYFVEHFIGKEPEQVIIVDMIGDKNLNIEMEYFSYHNSPRLVNQVWQIADDLGFSQFKPEIGQLVYDDHYPFIENGYNAIDIIDFEYPWWHTLEDTPDKCSPASLDIVGQTLLQLIFSE